MFLVLWLETFGLTICISAFVQDVKSSDFAELIYIVCGLIAPLTVVLVENRNYLTDIFNVSERVNKLRTGFKYILNRLSKRKTQNENISFKENLSLQPMDSISSEHPEEYMTMGDEYFSAGLFTEALECYKRYVAMEKCSCSGYLKIGISQENLGDLEEAIRAYKKSVNIRADFIEGYISLGSCYCGLFNYNAAIELYMEAINKNPEEATLYYHLGIACEMSKRYPEAVKAYEMALELNPTDEEIIYHLGAVLTELRKYDEAISAYKSALQVKTTDYELFYNLSVIYSLIQKPEIAIDNLKKAIELNSGLKYLIVKNKAFDNIKAYPEFKRVIG
jgi:tetratricopeptide (TPR) repeat protein